MNRTLPERIFICGFMGTGKTTTGRRLAEALEMPFIDLDARIEEQEERSINTIFEIDGEAAFRSIEKKALLNLIRSDKGVVALGGGSLHNQHMVDHVKVNGLLVFIKTPLNEIIQRIMRRRNRPLLLDQDGNMKPEEVLGEELETLYEERLPLYAQAEVTVDTTQYATLESQITHLVKKIRYHVALH